MISIFLQKVYKSQNFPPAAGKQTPKPSVFLETQKLSYLPSLVRHPYTSQNKIKFTHTIAIGDFECLSEEILNRMKCNKREFLIKLKKSQKNQMSQLYKVF